MPNITALKNWNAAPDYDPDEIREKRESHDLTQPELAARIDVSATSISKWENGHTEPSAPVRVRLGKVFDDV